jgi:putative heme-binding domain-containing protein
MNIVGIPPQHDTFAMANALLIAPGEPERSVLYQRLSRRGRGQMPPLVSNRIDEEAVQLFREWISGLKPERSFVRAWSTEDVLPLANQLQSGRSFESGKRLFTELACIQCHRFQDEGGGVGPNLTGVASRLSTPEIVTSVLSPSEKVAAEFASSVIVTTDGRVLEGRIEREEEQAIFLRTSESFAEPVSLAKHQIESRSVSDRSLMPADAVHVLSQNELLDLLAFLLSDGKPEHSAYR